MATKSKIAWTEQTWNPLVGCSILSPGCHACYAMFMASRLRAMALADIAAGRNPGRKRHYIEAVDEDGRWTGKVIPVPEALADPLGWKAPRMVFVNSMSDLFHEAVPAEFIAQVWAVMAQTPRHTYQVLTKRADRMARLLSDPPPGVRWPLENVWLGVSVEDDKRAGERMGHLIETPAAVRFVSEEPSLGRVDWNNWLGDPMSFDGSRPPWDWHIVGVESNGPRVGRLGEFKSEQAWRDNAERTIQLCEGSGVAPYIKQIPIKGRVSHDPAEWISELRVREFPSVAAPSR